MYNFLKSKKTSSSIAYTKQQNLCTILLRISKTPFLKYRQEGCKWQWEVLEKCFTCLSQAKSSKNIKSNMAMQKVLKFLKIPLIKHLNIYRNMECVRESFYEFPGLPSIDKYATHPSIKNIKTRMISSKFKFFLQDW